MGMLDDIFGGDDSREEEMQENIDKIREKVQGSEASPAPGTGDDLQPPIQPADIEEDVEDSLPAPSDPGADPAAEPPEPVDDPLPGGDEPLPGGQRQGGGEDRSAEGPTHEDVPEPPELKDLDVPDIEKGPLFITVDKFRDALEAIADMRRVASEMEDYIGSMEGTLQEDRDTEDGVRRILDEAESDADELQDIVSP